MKTRVIPDIHGKNIWQKLISADVDKYILLGDYFDSFTIMPREQIDNVFEMMKHFTDKNSIWLYGNHDLQYMVNYHLASGYNETTQLLYNTELKEVFEKQINHVAYKQDNFVFSHAGISKRWLEQMWYDEPDIFTNQQEIAFWKAFRYWGKINTASKTSGGYDIAGPLWCRPEDKPINAFDGCTQICGHTKVEDIKYVMGLNDNIDFIYTDVFDSAKDLVCIDIVDNKVVKTVL